MSHVGANPTQPANRHENPATRLAYGAGRVVGSAHWGVWAGLGLLSAVCLVATVVKRALR